LNISCTRSLQKYEYNRRSVDIYYAMQTWLPNQRAWVHIILVPSWEHS
jgi:hypothetical protein